MVLTFDTVRPDKDILDELRNAGLRPTRQRLALARQLLRDKKRHVTAESLYALVTEAGVNISLATIYNNLHQFTNAGLLREVVLDSGVTYFDTNITNHHHLYYESEGRLEDIDPDVYAQSGTPNLPEGTRVVRVDVVIRVEKNEE